MAEGQIDLGPIGQALLDQAWQFTGRDDVLPQALLEQVDTCDAESRSDSLKKLSGLGAAAFGHGQEDVGARILSMLSLLGAARPALREELFPLFRSVQFSYALEFGDPKVALEISKDLSRAENHDLAAMLQVLVRIQQRMEQELGEKRGALLAGLMMPSRSEAGHRAKLEGEEWVLSEECAALVRLLLESAPDEARSYLEYLRLKLDVLAERTPEQQQEVAAGRRKGQALRQRVGAALRGDETPTSIFEKVDQLPTEPLDPLDLVGLLRQFAETRCESLADAAVLWLAARDGESLPGEHAGRLAGKLAMLMKPLTGHPVVSPLRILLLERALSSVVPDKDPEWPARLHYALAHEQKRYAEFSPDHLAALMEWRKHAWLSFLSLQRLGDAEYAGQSLSIYVEAVAALPPEHDGGREAALQLVRRLLDGSMEQVAPEVRGALLFQLGVLLGEEPDPAALEEARTALEEAHQCFGKGSGAYVRENCLRARLMLANLELRRMQRGDAAAVGEFERRFQAAQAELRPDDDPKGLVFLLLQYVTLLEEQGQRAAALEHVQRALAGKGLEVGLRVPLLWKRAQLRASLRQEGWLEAALRDLNEAQTLAGATPAPQTAWELAGIRAEVLKAAGRLEEAVEILNHAGLRLATAGAVVQEAMALATKLDLMFLLKDRQAALDALDRVFALSIKGVPEAAGPLATAARNWLNHELAYGHVECQQWRLEALETLSQSVSSDLGAELRRLLRRLRCRVLGDPAPAVLLAELEQAAAQDPSDLGGQHLLDAVHLASQTLGGASSETQRLARIAEERFLQEELRPGVPGHAGMLLDLAFLRLQQRDQPSKRDAAAVLRLVEKAEQLLPLADMSPYMQRRAREARLVARIFLLGHRAGQTATALEKEGRELWMEIRLLANDARWEQQKLRGQIGNLCNALRTCAVLDAGPLRALAREIEAKHQMERGDDLARLREVWPEDRLLAELCADPLYGRVADEDLRDLLMGEHAAIQGYEMVQASDVALRLLEPLQGRLLPAALPRLHKALGRVYTQHSGTDRATLFNRAMEHLRAAEAGWDQEDVAGYLDVLVDIANECLRVQDFLSNKDELNQQAVDALEKGLAHPRIGEHPGQHAMLLRVRGMIEHYRHVNPYDPDRFTGKAEGARWLEQALSVCPQGDVETRFQVLLGLANIRRDWAGALGRERDLDITASQPDRDTLLSSAIDAYHKSLALQDMDESINRIDIARAQKCLADALRLRRHEGDLEEARRLLHLSLEVRKELQYPMPRVESLVSLAQVELARYRSGHADALPATLEAAREGLGLLPDGQEHPLRYLLEELLMKATDRAGVSPGAETPPDPSVLARQRAKWILEMTGGAMEDPRGDLEWMFDSGISGRYEKSLLRKDGMKPFLTFSKRHKPDKDGVTQAGPVLEDLRQRFAQGMIEELVELLLGAQAATRRWSAEERGEYRRILAQTLQLAESGKIAWQSIASLQHQAAFQYLMDKDRELLTQEEWHQLESWARSSRDAVHSRDQQNPDLIELSRDLGLILMLGPRGGLRRRFDEARTLFEEARTMARLHHDHRVEDDLTLDLGTLLDHMADDDPSLRDQAITLYGELLDGPSRSRLSISQRSRVLANRGWARVCLPRERQPECLRQAVADLEEAERICGDSKELKSQRAHAVQHLASALCALTSYEPTVGPRTLHCLKEALRLFRELGNASEEARCYHILGLYYMNHGTPEEMPQALRFTALALERRRNNPVEFWETLGNMVILRRRIRIPLGDLGGDRELLDDVDRLIRWLRELGLSDRLLQTHEYGLWLIEMQQAPDPQPLLLQRTEAALQEAEALWGAAQTMGERQALSASLGGYAAQRTVLGQRAAETPLALLRHSLRGKARGLLHDQAARGQVDQQPHLLAQKAELLAKRRTLSGRNDPEAASERLAVSTALHDLHRSAVDVVSLPDIDEAALRTRLLREPQAALVDISVSVQGTVILLAHLDREGSLVLRSLPLTMTGQEIMSWLQGDAGWFGALGAYQRAVARHEDLLEPMEVCAARLEALMQCIHERLLGPAVSGLQAYGVVDLILSVHGPLCALPLAASCRLTDEGGPRYLIEDFRSVRMVASVAAFLHEEVVPRRPKRGLLFFAPGELDPMATHLQDVRDLWQAAGLTVQRLNGNDGSVSKGRVLEALDTAELAYFLCHGIYEGGRPERSGLLLDREGSQLLSVVDLEGWPRQVAARQVFLAACQSGRGTDGGMGAEWMSLAGQLMRSGVRVVIAALWDVLYQDTAALAKGYFAALMERSLPPAYALGEAMRVLLRQARERHQVGSSSEGQMARVQRLRDSPWSWAGFLLLGSE